MYLRALANFAFLLVQLFLVRSAFSETLNEAFELKRPPQLDVRLLVGGYAFEQGANTFEGFALEQTLTRYVSVVAAVSSYQFWKGTGGYDSPLTPAPKGAPRNFVRFEGGVDLIPFQATSLTVLGGEDVGDSHAPVIEGIFSSWARIHSSHPLNFGFDSWHYYQNGASSGTYDLRTIALSAHDFLLLAGVGGAIWGGGMLPSTMTHGGPELGLFIPKWHLEVQIQSGYGTSGAYGIVTASRHFGWEE
jgi:hypothetical protein